MPKKIDHIGKRYGRLVVLELAERRKYGNGTQLFLRCKCDCGKEAIVQSVHLVGQHTTSCGCFLRERQRTANTTHGHAPGSGQSPEFRAWCALKGRCLNKRNRAYKSYGGRGIKVCDRWLGERGFINFIADMGLRPSARHSMDRVDVDGNYCKENCRWADGFQQARNKRNTRKFTLNGVTKCAAEWNRDLDLGCSGVQIRIKNGWLEHKALTTPSLGLRRTGDKPKSGGEKSTRIEDDPRNHFTD